MDRLRSLLVPTLFAIVATAILTGLGVWQLHRLAWKEGLIAQIEARTSRPPVALPPPASWSGLRPSAYEYRHVALTGQYIRDKDTFIFRATEKGPGYLIVTPFALADGGTVLVNRGYIPADLKAKAEQVAAAPAGPVRITGLMRSSEPRNMFTPPDDVGKGVFFTRDPALIAEHDGLSAVAPFTIDVDADPARSGWPQGGATALSIPNNHFSYALTWFGLALGLLITYSVLVWRRLTEAEPSEEMPRSGPTSRSNALNSRQAAP